MNHGQIEVSELLQVQREGGRGLEVSGGVEGQRGGKQGAGESQALLSVAVPFLIFLSLQLFSSMPAMFPQTFHVPETM